MDQEIMQATDNRHMDRGISFECGCECYFTTNDKPMNYPRIIRTCSVHKRILLDMKVYAAYGLH